MKIEGRNAVREALQSDTTILKLMIANTANDKVVKEIMDLAKRKGVKYQFVDPQVLKKASATGKHQGVIAETSSYQYFDVQDILDSAKEKNKDPFILILDGIEDPHNLGSILRVCECMGVDGVVISKNRAVGVNETVIKVSAGATSYVKVACVTNIHQTMEQLKQKGIFIYACELGGEDIGKSNLTGPIAIVVGSEGKGMSQLTKKIADQVITIPMFGKVNSLNASVSAGMVLYEAMMQRRKHE